MQRYLWRCAITKPFGKVAHSIKSLRLDVESATEGQTWLLLPEGFRAQECGSTYPLPTSRPELQILSLIPVPNGYKLDSGSVYLRRAQKEYRRRAARRRSAALDASSCAHKVIEASKKLDRQVEEFKSDAAAAVESVKKAAEEGIASLNDLFSLGKKGLEAQMRAHLGDQELNGEKINAKAFRECFQMVTQAVKGLGIPSDDRQKATEVVENEAAQAIKGMQDALSMAPGSQNPETEH